jgi:hypothetical protein
MNKATTLFLLLAFYGGVHLAQANPTIGTQPASRTNNVGDNAQFAVTASGSGTLTYQWKLNGADIAGATTSAYNVIVDSSKAGTYTVVVTDANGPTTSSDAVLSIPFGSRLKLAQWNFNGTTAQSSGSVSGTYSAYGSPSANTTGTGSPSDPATSGNASWKGQSWGTANKSRGLQINLSTLGYKDIAVTWERRPNQTGTTSASKYVRLQYTLNGTTWTDYTVDTATTVNAFFFRSSDLSGISGANNNPQFAFRLTAEWESTAISPNPGTAAFVGIGTYTYDSGVNMLFDMVTVLGTVYTPPDDPPVVVTSPQSQTVVVGDNVTFNVSATGGHLVYYWKLGGNVISSGTSSSLTLPNVQLTDAGTYSVIVSNSAGIAPSAGAVLTVLQPLGPDRFWSADGTTAGGAGTWDDTTFGHWGLTPDGPFGLRWRSGNSDNAAFVATGASPGTITVASPGVTVSKMMITNASGSATYGFTGTGTMTFTNNGEIYLAGTTGSSGINSVTMSCMLSGPVVIKNGGGG